MTQITIGEVDWDTAAATVDKKDRASDFMALEEGINEGRVLSNPQQFAVHWVVDATGKKRKVNCATTGCPVCLRGQDGDKAAARWLIKFYSRRHNAVKLVEITSQVIKGIGALVSNPKWGPVTNYDVNLNRAAPGSQPLYTVVPSPPSPITAEERQALAEFNDRVKVEKFIAPPTPAVVAEKLGWAADGGSTGAKAVTNAFQSATTAKPASKAQSTVKFDFDL